MSLFTNVTRDPGATVICAELIPADVIVMVALPADGEDGDLPPQAASGIAMRTARRRRTRELSHAPVHVPRPAVVATEP